jgi:hypothetical protein
MFLEAVRQISRGLAGLILTAAILSGVGFWVGRLFRSGALPFYWRLPLSLVLGEAALSLAVQASLFAHAPTRFALPGAAIAAAAAGFGGWLAWLSALRSVPAAQRPRFGAAEHFLMALIALSLLINFAIAAAPSTKIDELYYHMLLPKRIVEDGGLRFYLLPLEQAVLPQMHYQILLSVAQALHLPDLGNLASLGFSMALLLALGGACYRETRNARYALLAASAAAAGLYASVWHVTGGAHALGDLAAFLAGMALLRPFADRIGATRYVALVSTLCSVAAGAKISIWPLAALGAGLAVVVARSALQEKAPRIRLAAAAALPWVLIHAPLMVWTFHASGSPWGPLAAGWFGPTVFPRRILAGLAEMRIENQAGLGPALLALFPRLSPLFLAAIVWLVARVRSLGRAERVLLLLAAGQVACIAAFLPNDFRFLGGLQFVLLFAAAVRFFRGRHAALLLRRIPLLAALLVAPWVALQWYYGAPFLRLMSGSLSREAFLTRYVAFYQDFRKLDALLPRDSVLYCPDCRFPAFYAPRPLVFTMLDWDRRRPVYWFDLGSPGELSVAACPETVYSNPEAVAAAYRTPGSPPRTAPLVVRYCGQAPDPKGRRDPGFAP